VLAEQLERLLDEVRGRLGPEGPVPAEAPSELDDNAPLDTPIEEEFRVGSMALVWDGEDDRVVIEARAVSEDPEAEQEPLDDSEDGPDTLRVRISASQARAFVRRALRVVAAGRPSCPLCGLPMDPSGHICPRQNGHRA
jgi:uncharacterized repeat protein (TIGR03847 family)